MSLVGSVGSDSSLDRRDNMDSYADSSKGIWNEVIA